MILGLENPFERNLRPEMSTLLAPNAEKIHTAHSVAPSQALMSI